MLFVRLVRTTLAARRTQHPHFHPPVLGEPARLLHQLPDVPAGLLGLGAGIAASTGEISRMLDGAAFQQLNHQGARHGVFLGAFALPRSDYDLIASILSPFDSKRGNINYGGPAVQLSPDLASSLSLVLHELATNASKYGSLTESQGRVQIGWDLRRDGARQELCLVWREEGGPPVERPDRQGFGITMMHQLLERQPKALDRVLLHHHFVVPSWHLASDRLIYWDKFGVSPPHRRGRSPPSCRGLLRWRPRAANHLGASGRLGS